MPRWGLDHWGGNLNYFGDNLSFEVEDLIDYRQGWAYKWQVTTLSDVLEIGVFDAAVGDVSWESKESFEGLWCLPYDVHQAKDAALELVELNASDLPTALLLANELRLKYSYHLASSSHAYEDLLNVLSAPAATDLPSLITLVTDELNALNAHAWSARFVHGRADHLAFVSAAVPTDLPTAKVVLNALKYAFNGHILRIQILGIGEVCRFAFTDEVTQLEYTEFADGGLKFESFEKGFAIPDLFPLLADQAKMVTVDTLITWMSGHVELLNWWEHITSESLAPEGFSADWYLPGTITAYPSSLFIERYYDASLAVFRFRDEHLQSLDVESFETGWSSNEVGIAKYWSGSTWRFLDSQVIAAGFEDYLLGDLNLVTNSATYYTALSPPEYSPDLYLKVTEAVLMQASGDVSVKDRLGVSRAFYFFLDGALDVGALIETFAATSNPLATRYYYHQMYDGVTLMTHLGVTALQPSGKVEFWGWKRTWEYFDISSWVSLLVL